MDEHYPSSIQIRNQLILKIQDHVLEPELAFFHALDLDFVGFGKLFFEHADGGVEVAVFCAKLGQQFGDGGGFFWEAHGARDSSGLHDQFKPVGQFGQTPKLKPALAWIMKIRAQAYFETVLNGGDA